MNIASRLEKLESAVNAGRGLCVCLATQKVEIYHSKVDSFGKPTEPKLQGDPVKAVCGACGLRIERQRIILEFVSSRD